MIAKLAVTLMSAVTLVSVRGLAVEHGVMGSDHLAEVTVEGPGIVDGGHGGVGDTSEGAGDFSVTTAGTLAEAHAALAAAPPRVLLTDLQLPDGHGVEIFFLESHELCVSVGMRGPWHSPP